MSCFLPQLKGTKTPHCHHWSSKINDRIDRKWNLSSTTLLIFFNGDICSNTDCMKNIIFLICGLEWILLHLGFLRLIYISLRSSRSPVVLCLVLLPLLLDGLPCSGKIVFSLFPSELPARSWKWAGKVQVSAPDLCHPCPCIASATIHSQWF